MSIAVILASGKGKRMKMDKNKVLLTIGKKPLLFYTLNVFEKNSDIKKIIITIRQEELATIKKLSLKFKKIESIILGGSERQNSAFNALQYLNEKIGNKDNPIIVFHNGSNPFVTHKEISQSIKMAKKYGACAVAHPTKDTIKEVDTNGMVVKTLERKRLWNMQTPQAIQFRLAMKAFLSAYKDNFIGTDDTSLVERLGGKVKVIQGSPYNFKITNQTDLKLAKVIFRDFKKTT